MIGRRCASGMELAGRATEGEGASYVYPSLEGVGAQRVGFEWDGATGFGFRKLGTGRRARWSVRGFAACSGRPACPPRLLLLDWTGLDGTGWLSSRAVCTMGTCRWPAGCLCLIPSAGRGGCMHLANSVGARPPRFWIPPPRFSTRFFHFYIKKNKISKIYAE